jgi:hypothetical protein
LVTETEVTTKVNGRRFIVQETVGAELDLKAILALCPYHAAGPIGLFENCDFAGWKGLL